MLLVQVAKLALVNESGRELVPFVSARFVDKGKICLRPRIWSGTGPVSKLGGPVLDRMHRLRQHVDQFRQRLVLMLKLKCV